MSAHADLSLIVASAANYLRAFKTLTGVVPLPQDAISDLQRARIHGKRSIGVTYALTQITKHIPSHPEKFPSHAKAILDNLSAKGIGPGMVELPVFLHRVLAKMLETHVAPADPSQEPQQL